MNKTGENPTLTQLQEELAREERKTNSVRVVRNTFIVLIVVAAITSILAIMFVPILELQGTSMTPTLSEGDTIGAIKLTSYKSGDIIAFYHNNSILVKRIIACQGDWVDIDEDGNVSVNNVKLEEPYVSNRSLGQCDTEFPIQVPDGRYFVMGDSREESLDSRLQDIGTISESDIVGKIIVRIWPLSSMKFIK